MLLAPAGGEGGRTGTGIIFFTGGIGVAGVLTSLDELVLDSESED